MHNVIRYFDVFEFVRTIKLIFYFISASLDSGQLLTYVNYYVDLRTKYDYILYRYTFIYLLTILYCIQS